ncbi:MAG: type II toxin-antitoxin system VapC family toxin [Nanoarchaeota archaeon]
MYLLDSDFIVGIFRNNKEAIQKIKDIEEKDINFYISSLSIHELIEGAYLSSKPKENLEVIRTFINNFFIFDFNLDCAKISGKISSDLTKKGEKIGEIDVLLSSIAMYNNLTLITRNTKHFEKINGLKMISW